MKAVLSNDSVFSAILEKVYIEHMASRASESAQLYS